MFSECSSLKKLNLSRFDIKKNVDITGMLSECISLYDLKLFHFKNRNISEIADLYQQ